MIKKFIDDFRVVRNRRLNPDYFILELTTDSDLPEILPGQFVEVRVDNARSTFLRRPISVHDVDYGKNILKLLVQIVGEGTQRLAWLEEDDFVNLMYPLGNSFSLPEGNEVLLVGGGCGVAPLLYLSRYLSERDITVNTLIGVRNKDLLIEIEEYKKYGRVFITTEDGSEGERGYVTNHSILNKLSSFSAVYTCGPEIMMKAVAKRAKAAGVTCEVSLENMMACGIGACLCCVTDTVEGNKCTCTDGPIFNINYLKWQI